MSTSRLHLTPREVEVLTLLDQDDATIKSVARALGIAERTAETHLRNAYARLGVHRYRDAMRRLAEQGDAA